MTNRANESVWRWFGFPGHLIVSNMCRFHMATQVGKYLISTVGEYRPEGDGKPRRTIGAGDQSFFETYVFEAGQTCSVAGCGCGMPDISGSEIDGERSATAGDATAKHYEYCNKYAELSKEPK